MANALNGRFRASNIRSQQLVSFQNTIEQHPIKLKNICEIRFVSVLPCVLSLTHNITTILQFFDHNIKTDKECKEYVHIYNGYTNTNETKNLLMPKAVQLFNFFNDIHSIIFTSWL